MENNFDHFLITRFNLKKEGWKTDKNSARVLNKNWLKNRVKLFLKFCLPSVLAQSSKNFKWLIFFEKGSETKLKKLLSELEEHEFIEPVFLNGYTEFQTLLPSLIFKRISNNKNWVLTTRLDNDDAINRKFMARLEQSIQNPKNNTVYHFPQGVCLDIGQRNRLASLVYPLNQFVSLLEKVESNKPIKTVLCREHDTWDSTFTLVKVNLPDAWLQVTHSRNMANTYRGVSVYSKRLKAFSIHRITFNWNYDLSIAYSRVKSRIKKLV